MILNGKAKEDFFTWINRYIPNKESFECEMNINDLYFKTSTELNALIIEWLDSVGIYVSTQVMQTPVSHKVYFECLIRSDRTKVSDFYTTRQEATEQAIITANEIYNDRTK